MEKHALDAVVQEHLDVARRSSAARSSLTLFGGHDHALRQTVVALAAGASLGEHENPGEATVQILAGRVRLAAGPDSAEGAPGDLLVIPDARHTLEAIEDSAVLLTAVPRNHVRA